MTPFPPNPFHIDPKGHCPMKKGQKRPLAYFSLFSESAKARRLEKRRARWRLKRMTKEQQNEKQNTEEMLAGSLRLDIKPGLQMIGLDYGIVLPKDSPFLLEKNREVVEFWMRKKLQKLEREMKRDPMKVIIWAKNHMPRKGSVVKKEASK